MGTPAIAAPNLTLHRANPAPPIAGPNITTQSQPYVHSIYIYIRSECSCEPLFVLISVMASFVKIRGQPSKDSRGSRDTLAVTLQQSRRKQLIFERCAGQFHGPG
jgi:hypothetical protein